MQQLISIDEDSNNIGEEFKEFLNKQTEIINNLISSNLSNFIYTSNIIQTKIDIYNFLQNKVILILTELNKNNSYQKNKENSEKITTLFQLLVNINALIKEKELSLYKIIGILHSKDKASKGQNYENEIYHLKNELIEKNKQIKVLENMNLILNEQIEKIKLENDTLTIKLLGKSKKYINDETIKSGLETIMKNNNDKNYLNKTNNNNTINSRINLPNMPKSSFNKQIIVSKKKLSREQLNEIIQNIYKSKIAYDQNCIDLNKPLETMEQHMYQYLNNKYGLKNLTIEYASAIISGIKDYSKKDMNIKLFGMLLKNEIEENTLAIVEKIKQVVEETLEYFITQKNPYMSTGDVLLICDKIKKGMVDEDVWNSFIDTLFLNDKENGNKVKEKIYEFIDRIMKKSLEKLGNNLKFEMTREEEDFFKEMQNYPKKIRYEDLINILIDYHIKVRKNYLKNMREIFMDNDDNKDGVLTKKEFIKYINDLKIFHEETIEENIDYLLRKIPQCEKYDFFSFSEVVGLFDQEQILKENNEKCSILDFLAK
jgi:hypothetical protein